MLTLEDFLREVIVWPDDPNSETGWVTLHWRGRDKKGITGGQAFKTLEDVHSFIRWSQTRGKGVIADIYYCTSLQEQHGDRKPSGHYAALRSIDNARASRILFTDVDKYPTKAENFAAIETFCRASGSPFPSALVDSGGGCHAYWILSQPLEKEQWLEVAHKFEGLMNAHGLKHDNISTDMARILRPPDTLNWKRADEGNPPQPVLLKALNGYVDLGAWKSLHAATPAAATVTRSSVHRPPADDMKYLAKLPKELRAGPSPLFRDIPVEEEINGVINPTPILQLCPMFRETFSSGGKEVGQPLWHQQALATTFLDGGRELFRDLGRKHPSFSPENSDEMFDRKVRDRALKSLGYPSCAVFERDGSTQCKSCPIRGKVQSPLNIDAKLLQEMQTPDPKVDVEQPAEVTQENTASPPEPKLPRPPSKYPMPPEFIEDDEGIINLIVGSGKNAKPEPLFQSKFLEVVPFKEATGNAIGLRLVCTGGPGEVFDVTIPSKAFRDAQGGGIYAALNDQGCLTMGHSTAVMKLMSTLRGRITREEGAARAVPYGWEYKDRREGEGHQGEPIGFAYNGWVYSPDGKKRETYGGDPKLLETYCVTGKPEPWVAAIRTIIGMHSPGLQTVVLAAFAAPLMIFSGQPSTVVMVRGQSGGSKSTASAVACAVWARPRTAMMKPSSSRLGVMRRMGKIRHLPTIWDDIRNEQFEAVKDTLMEITQGGEGLKLDQNREERDQGVWDNMLLTSSNSSLVEYLEDQSKNDGASLVRCFEFEVPKIVAGSAAYEDPNRIANLVASLDHNHGHAGRDYALMLGSDPAGLQRMYNEIHESFVDKIKPYQPHERFWMAACVTIIMGAQLANNLAILRMNSVKFNISLVEEFLVETYKALRKRHSEANIHADTHAFVRHYLSMFINTYVANRNEVVFTKDAPAGKGKPFAALPIWPTGDDLRKVKSVSLRWVFNDRKVKISKAALDRFLRQEKVSVDRMKEGLLLFYGAKLSSKVIAAGIANIGAQAPEPIYEIEIRPGSWLDDILQGKPIEDVSQKTVRPPNGQSHHQPGTHLPPEREGQAGETDAS